MPNSPRWVCRSRAWKRRAYLDHLGHVTPLLAAEALVLREARVLLMRRRDTGLWGLPGGMAEVGFFDWDGLPPLHPGHERSLAVAREALRTGQPFFDAEPARALEPQGALASASSQRHWKVRVARTLTRLGGSFLLRARPVSAAEDRS